MSKHQISILRSGQNVAYPLITMNPRLVDAFSDYDIACEYELSLVDLDAVPEELIALSA